MAMKLSEIILKERALTKNTYDAAIYEEWERRARRLEAVVEAAKRLDYDSPMRWQMLDWIELDNALAALED